MKHMTCLVVSVLGLGCLDADVLYEVEVSGSVHSDDEGPVELWFLHDEWGEGTLETRYMVIDALWLEEATTFSQVLQVPQMPDPARPLAWQRRPAPPARQEWHPRSMRPGPPLAHRPVRQLRPLRADGSPGPAAFPRTAHWAADSRNARAALQAAGPVQAAQARRPWTAGVADPGAAAAGTRAWKPGRGVAQACLRSPRNRSRRCAAVRTQRQRAVQVPAAPGTQLLAAGGDARTKACMLSSAAPRASTAPAADGAAMRGCSRTCPPSRRESSHSCGCCTQGKCLAACGRRRFPRAETAAPSAGACTGPARRSHRCCA